MKTRFILDLVEETGFSVYAINSHAKGYKLCWNMNKTLLLDFEKVQDQTVDKQTMFSRYHCITRDGIEYNIVTNRSKQGYFIPDQKSINYFLVVSEKHNENQKKEFIGKLKENNEILLAFELDVTKTKYIERFIFDDTKN